MAKRKQVHTQHVSEANTWALVSHTFSQGKSVRIISVFEDQTCSFISLQCAAVFLWCLEINHILNHFKLVILSVRPMSHLSWILSHRDPRLCPIGFIHLNLQLSVCDGLRHKSKINNHFYLQSNKFNILLSVLELFTQSQSFLLQCVITVFRAVLDTTFFDILLSKTFHYICPAVLAVSTVLITTCLTLHSLYFILIFHLAYTFCHFMSPDAFTRVLEKTWWNPLRDASQTVFVEKLTISVETLEDKLAVSGKESELTSSPLLRRWLISS